MPDLYAFAMNTETGEIWVIEQGQSSDCEDAVRDQRLNPDEEDAGADIVAAALDLDLIDPDDLADTIYLVHLAERLRWRAGSA